MQHSTMPQQCNECPGRFVCRCLRVTEETVLEVLAVYPVKSVKELKALTGAGDGCTCCHRRLQNYIERFSLALEAECASEESCGRERLPLATAG